MQNKIEKIEAKFIRKFPEFSVGDIIAVSQNIQEGSKTRVQVFKGLVLSIKGKGISKTFTIRKISYGVGVEKIFPLYSPTIKKIQIFKKSKVRKAKLYYMRKRGGKRALKVGKAEDVLFEEISEGDIKEVSDSKIVEPEIETNEQEETIEEADEKPSATDQTDQDKNAQEEIKSEKAISKKLDKENTIKKSVLV